MKCGPADFEWTDELFKKIIPIQNFSKKIYLIDEDNQHKDLMINLIKNNFYPYLAENAQVIFMDIENLKPEVTNSIICAPIAFETMTRPEEWYKLINNNIFIAPYDDLYLYPWSLDNVYVANYSLHWGTNLHGHDTAVTGYSIYCAFLAIMALNGADYLQKLMEKIDALNVKEKE